MVSILDLRHYLLLNIKGNEKASGCALAYWLLGYVFIPGNYVIYDCQYGQKTYNIKIVGSRIIC